MTLGILAVVFLGVAFVMIVVSLRPETFKFPGMPPVSGLVEAGEFKKITREDLLEGLISNYAEATEGSLEVQKARDSAVRIILAGLIGGAILTGLVTILLVFSS